MTDYTDVLYTRVRKHKLWFDVDTTDDYLEIPMLRWRVTERTESNKIFQTRSQIYVQSLGDGDRIIRGSFDFIASEISSVGLVSGEWLDHILLDHRKAPATPFTLFVKDTRAGESKAYRCLLEGMDETLDSGSNVGAEEEWHTVDVIVIADGVINDDPAASGNNLDWSMNGGKPEDAPAGGLLEGVIWGARTEPT